MMTATVGNTDRAKTRAATATHTHDRSNQAQTTSQIRTEYWAKRIIWFLISLTRVWDIAVTFDKHFALMRRFF